MSFETIELEAKLIERAAAKRSEIISNAEKRADEVINNAEKEAENIVADARKRARERAFKILESDLRALRDRILGEAELEGRRILANTKEAILSRVFKEVERRIIDVANGKAENVDYKDMLLRLIKEAVLSIDEKELIIAANERDKEYLHDNLGRIEEEVSKALGYDVKLRVEKEPLDCLGGVVVYDVMRKKICYNTLEGRLQKFRGKLEADLAKTLFGG